MLRALAAFFLIFSVLSLVLHLNITMELLGTGALVLFVIDLLGGLISRESRPSRMRGLPLL